jgi:hypothetical protein
LQFWRQFKPCSILAPVLVERAEQRVQVHEERRDPTRNGRKHAGRGIDVHATDARRCGRDRISPGRARGRTEIRRSELNRIIALFFVAPGELNRHRLTRSPEIRDMRGFSTMACDGTLESVARGPAAGHLQSASWRVVIVQGGRRQVWSTPGGPPT